MKEYRVYVFDYKKYLQDWYKYFDYHVDADAIDDWHEYDRSFDRPTTDAIKLIDLCEQDGKVYTLETFFSELNNDNINTDNYLFYTTNKY